MRRYATWALVGALLFGLGFGIAKAYYGWTRISTPCSRINALASTGQGHFAVVCDDEPGTILVQQ